MSKTEIGALSVSLALEAGGFTKQIGTINKEVKNLDREFKNAGKGVDGFENSVEGLEKKLSTTTRQLDLYSKKLDAQKGQYADLDSKLQGQVSKLNQLEETLGKTSKEWKNQADLVSQTSSKMSRLQTDISSTEGDMRQLGNTLNSTRESLDRLGNVNGLNGITGDLKQIETQAEKVKKSMKEVGEAMKDAGEKTEKLSESMALVSVGAIASATEGSNALGKLQGSLGITKAEAEKLKEAGRDISQDGFEFGETINTLSKVKQVMGDALSPKQAEALTKQVQVMNEYFDTDTSEVLKTTDQLMKQFGLTGSEATDMITYGMQNGLNASDDFLDTLWEYSGYFSDLGFTADETLAIISKGMKDGTFNTDKLADTLKEGKIRLLEMNKASGEAITSLGLNATEVQKNIGAGGATASKQMKELAKKIIDIKDPIKQNAAGVALFGTQFEDLGIDAIKAIADVGKTTIDTKNSAQELTEAYEETFGAKLQGLVADGKVVLEDLGIALMPLAEKVIEIAGKFAEWFSGLDEGTVNAIASLVGLGVVLSPLLKVAGSGIIVFNNLSQLMGATGTGAKILSGAMSGLTKVAGFLSGGVGLGAIAVVLAGLAIKFGDNEDAILGLQEKFGSFGTIVSGLCEFISGVWDLTFGRMFVKVQLAMDLIAAVMDGAGGATVADAWKRYNARIDSLNTEGVEKLKLTTTRGMSQLRNATDTQLSGMVTSLNGIMGQIPAIADGHYKTASSNIATQLNGMSSSQLTMLTGMNNTTKQLFAGISSSMSVDESSKKVQANLKRMKDAGKIDVDTMSKDIESAMTKVKGQMDTKTKEASASASKNMKDGATKVGQEANNMANSAKQGTGKVASNTDADFKKANQSIQREATDMYNGTKNSYTKLSDVAKQAGSDMYRGVTTSASKMASSAKASASDMYRGVTTSTNAMANKAIADWNRVKSAYSRSIRGSVTVSKSTVETRGLDIPDMETRVMSMPSMADFGIGASIGGMETRAITSFSDGFGDYDYNSSMYSGDSSGNVRSLSPSNRGDNETLRYGIEQQTSELKQQNNLLMKMVTLLTQDRQVDLSVQIDGRQVAKATSSYMDNELRRNRDSQTRASGGR